ncbi:cation-translocating P-type ATPase [Aerosticca soli]|uniref:Lead, cadmium, zinc and mercury transporting ATPase n=1 Tax=Aerosticca soli TaxID=2010829 RepID=A0A2Z6E334_9GAMM|nr:cation-transporting P-type ATPase [Aerosticca soli]BBD78948.1 lead, cadmium, zinc and mercury transporting ATPase [Aerosticca soli]
MQNEPAKGLPAEQVRALRERFGPNVLFARTPVRFWAIAREEVTEPMILLLLVVGVAYSLWGARADAVTIFIVIAVLVLAEVWNEYRAKRAIAALERIAAPRSRVIRDGTLVEVDSEELVPGDLLVLATGTRIAADARVTTSLGLACDESALTGESFPVEKQPGDTVFAGTVVVGGEGEAVVTAIGQATRLGGIGRTLGEVRQPRTPLQLAMRALAGKLVWVAVFFATLIPLIGVLRGQDWRQMVLTGLSLAFATIPEELPIIITMVLGLGAYALSRKHFLIKRLRAAETLGDVTVIVTDKTGTLTESRMQVASLFPEDRADAVLQRALDNLAEHVTDPLEQALAQAAAQRRLPPPAGAIVRMRPPGQGRKTKSTLRRLGDTLRLTVSGAPEEIAARVRAQPAQADAFIAAETARGRRLIAVAGRELAEADAARDWDELEHELEWIGLVSFEDPPRAGVRETLERAAAAGIRTLMVTGDHPATAASIAAQVGIPAGRVITGAELDALSDAALEQTLREAVVFARTTPEHKLRIVGALQRAGEVVAVTGDGVNDALALKAADVGIAMGIRGTDVARDAADIVLADDNYVTIIRGVFEGRKFYDNLKKGVTYYLAVKLGLILIFLLPVLIGLPLPFSPIQIIVLELFMDLAASAGFVMEPAEPAIYARRPHRRGEVALLDRPALRSIGVRAVLLFAAVMAGYGLAASQGADTTQLQTCAFAAWMLTHVALAFVSRSQTRSALAHGLFGNWAMDLWALAAVAFLLAAMYLPVLQAHFHMSPMPWPRLLAVTVAALGAAVLADAAKRLAGERGP